jgi:thymidylate kinase
LRKPVQKALQGEAGYAGGAHEKLFLLAAKPDFSFLPRFSGRLHKFGEGSVLQRRVAALLARCRDGWVEKYPPTPRRGTKLMSRASAPLPPFPVTLRKRGLFLLLRDNITEMKVLILEGIATSGKSTVITHLKKVLEGLKVVVADESDTHEPIMEKRSDKHIGFYKTLIHRMLATRPDLLIFDRLYLTQAFRAKCDISDYSEIEELLSKYSPLTIYLKVDEAAIEDRISKAAEHRGSDYFKFRGTSKERAQYYIDQQRHQLKSLERSTLPYKVINTTDNDYDKVVQEILEFVKQK